MLLKETTKNQKAKKVQQIFSSLADNYDRANKVITLGMDKGWRKKVVQWSEAPPKKAKILDCATGTGALAFEYQTFLDPSAQITGVDFCQNMLIKAQERAQNKAQEQAHTNFFNFSSKKPSFKNLKNIHFQQADIHCLPFPDNMFDVSAMAYGLRNVADPPKVLKEMARVTQSGGKVMILETGDKPAWFLKPFFDMYFRYMVPFLGGLVTGKKGAYRYLQESSNSFPSRGELLKIMKTTGAFNHLEYKTLFLGASFIYKAWVI